MKINEIEINNFYSIKKVKVAFDKYKGIVLIEGKNRDTGGSNGSGKSALLEAIVWGLFGKTIRKSTEEAMVNNAAKKNCVVTIRVNDNVVIRRGKRPTLIEVWIDGENRTLENLTATQAFLEQQVLKTNYKVFLASAIFGQQNSIEFVNATPEDKRTIIKNFLNLDHVFNMRDSVKYLKSEYSGKVKACDTAIAEHESYIKKFDKQLAYLKELQQEIEKSKLSLALDLDFEEIIQLESETERNSWEIVRHNRDVEALDNRLKDITKKLDNPNEVSKCNTCGQPIQGESHPKYLMSTFRQIQQEIRQKEEEVAELEKLNSLISIPVSSKDYGKVMEYRNLLKEEETYKSLKADTLEKIQQAHTEKQQASSSYEVMRFWEKAFSEAGLVKYIIRNVLNHFNGKVNFYLSHLTQGKFTVQFDEELRETITTKKKNIHYMSLSGGEKKKISLAVMLGLQELLLLSNPDESNLMFFDEVAENLDQDGLDGLYILLSELKKTKTLFIITHNNYLKSLLDNAKPLTITKYRGISTLKDK
jgi:DNA repair exonuclease SbcCD ATPase subunit